MGNNKKNTPKESYKPEILGLIVGSGALILWYFSSLAIDKAVVPSSFQSIVTICGSAFGAFFGAYCAFKLRQYEESQNKSNKRKAALDSCLFTMARQRNAVSLMKKEYDKYPGEFARAFLMPAAKPPEYKDVKVNLEDLMFLTNHESVMLLFHLSIEQERFEQVVFAVNNRNTYTVDHLQPALAKHGVNGKTISARELKETLGEMIFKTSINAANNAHELLIASEKSILKIHNELRETAKSMYPGEKFLKLEDADPITSEEQNSTEAI